MNTHKEEQAPIEWLLDDLLITILDSSPKELIGLHNKLEALAESIQERKSELAPIEPKETPHSESINEGHPNRYGADPFSQEWVELEPKKEHEHVWVDSMKGTECLECHHVEPTPPSQIEEESQTQRSLREMYELGKEHGRTLALKDIEIERLIKETEELL